MMNEDLNCKKIIKTITNHIQYQTGLEAFKEQGLSHYNKTEYDQVLFYFILSNDFEEKNNEVLFHISKIYYQKAKIKLKEGKSNSIVSFEAKESLELVLKYISKINKLVNRTEAKCDLKENILQQFKQLDEKSIDHLSYTIMINLNNKDEDIPIK